MTQRATPSVCFTNLVMTFRVEIRSNFVETDVTVHVGKCHTELVWEGTIGDVQHV